MKEFVVVVDGKAYKIDAETPYHAMDRIMHETKLQIWRSIEVFQVHSLEFINANRLQDPSKATETKS